MPTNWLICPLGFVLEINRGGSPRPISSYITNNPNGINWIKISDASANGKYIYNTKEKINANGVSKSRYVKENDFLLTNSMSFGRPYILKTSGCIHDGWLVLTDINKIFDQEFLYYLLSSPFAYNQLSDKVSGGVVKNLNIEKVKASMCPIPPLNEQNKIVSLIHKFENIINF